MAAGDVLKNNGKCNGEIEAMLGDVKKESRNMMEDLIEADNLLLSLQDRLQSGEVDKEKILEVIKSVRLRIGVLEDEDKREMSEEEIASNLLNKLRKWVDVII